MYEMQTDAPRTLHLDELKEHAVRDISRLTPGTRVLFGHVPLLRDPSFEDHRREPFGMIGTVVETGYKTFAELHPNLRDPIPTDPTLAIIYKDESTGRETYRYAADSGVITYGKNGGYNSHNFAVVLSDFGISDSEELLLTVSEGYQERLDLFNSQIIVYPIRDYNYYYEDYNY